MFKNIVIITSVINAPSFYLPTQRYEQVLNTIDSIYTHIPKPYIILIEGSNDIDEHLFNDKGIHKLIFHSIGQDKSSGELQLLQLIFSSDIINQITNQFPIQTINKISGRYSFCFDFSFNDNFKYKLRTDTWSGNGVCDTRYYRFPISYLSEFKKRIGMITDIFIDIEHTFYKYQVLPIDKNLIECVLDVHGHFSPSGQYIRD